MPQQLQVQPLKLKQKIEYKSHYMYDMIWKDKIIGALTCLKQHTHHYADIQINADWCASSRSCDLAALLDEKHTSAVTVDMNITDIKVVNGDINNVSCDRESTGKSIQSKQNIDSNDCLVVENDDVEGFEEIKGVEEDTELIEDQAALDQWQELTGDPLPVMVQINNLENQIYQCVSGKNNIPKYLLLDDEFEILAFPDLFPYGQGACHLNVDLWSYQFINIFNNICWIQMGDLQKTLNICFVLNTFVTWSKSKVILI